MTNTFTIKENTFIRGNEFTDKELQHYVEIAEGQGILVGESYRCGLSYQNGAYYHSDICNDLAWYEAEDCLQDDDLDATQDYRNYLDNDRGEVAAKKPFTRDDLNEGMVLDLKGDSGVYFIMFNGIHEARTSEKFTFVCDFDNVDEDMQVHGIVETPIPIVRVEYAGKVLFDRTLEEELKSLEKQKKEIEDKIKLIKGE